MEAGILFTVFRNEVYFSQTDYFFTVLNSTVTAEYYSVASYRFKTPHVHRGVRIEYCTSTLHLEQLQPNCLRLRHVPRVASTLWNSCGKIPNFGGQQ